MLRAGWIGDGSLPYRDASTGGSRNIARHATTPECLERGGVVGSSKGDVAAVGSIWQDSRIQQDGAPRHPEGGSSAKVPAYYSISPGDRDVHHDHADCPVGATIMGRNRRPGTGLRQRCKDCLVRD